MLRDSTTLAVMLALPAFFVVAAAGCAQNGESRIDREYSTASLSLVSSSSGLSWNVAIAQVSGTVTLSDNPDKDVFDLDIYPARQGSRLLKRGGGFREDNFADLSRYAVMSFRSSRGTQNRDGEIAVAGLLSVTYVHRPANIVWSNAYSGPEYEEPVAETTTRAVAFVFAAGNRTTPTMHNHGTEEFSALATIDLRNFPELRAAWLDSVWPIVVENEHCEMPRIEASMKDYKGAICTGTPVQVTPLSPPPQRFGTDYPGPNQVAAPATDKATILVHLRLEGRN